MISSKKSNYESDNEICLENPKNQAINYMTEIDVTHPTA